MRQQKLHGQSLKLLAGAVILGLGSASAFAQQQGAEQETDRFGGQSEQAEQPGQASDQPGQQSDRPGQQSDQPGIAGESEQQEDQPGIAGESEQQEESDVQTAARDQQGQGEQQLDQLAQEHEELSTFVEALRAAGMTDALTQGTEYTIFAPTNDAFEQMSGMSTEELLREENRDQLVSLLRAHIVADDVDEEMAGTIGQAQTIDGGTIEISADESGEIMVGDSQVVESSDQGSLRVYAVDGVLSQGTQVAQAPEEQSGAQQQDEAETSDDPFGDESESDDPLGESESDDPFGDSESGAGAGSDDPFGASDDDEQLGQ